MVEMILVFSPQKKGKNLTKFYR